MFATKQGGSLLDKTFSEDEKLADEWRRARGVFLHARENKLLSATGKKSTPRQDSYSWEKLVESDPWSFFEGEASNEGQGDGVTNSPSFFSVPAQSHRTRMWLGPNQTEHLRKYVVSLAMQTGDKGKGKGKGSKEASPDCASEVKGSRNGAGAGKGGGKGGSN